MSLDTARAARRIRSLGSGWSEGYVVLYRVEDTKASVAFLYAADSLSDPKPVGTCFFVDYRDLDDRTGDNLYGPYLVTAKHVWEDHLKNANEAFVRVWSPSGEKSNIPLNVSEGEWLFHHDEHVDLAVQVWTRDRWYGNAIDITVWPLEPLSMPVSPTTSIKEGEDAVFVGLMTDFPGEKQDLPMLRGGMIGLRPEEKIHGAYEESDYFAVNVQSYTGNSGAPVFLASGGFSLMGVLTYGYYEASRPTAQGFSMYNIGVSLVTPVEKLEEILTSDRGREHKKDSHRPRQGTPLSAQPDLTQEEVKSALRKVSRGDGKEVIEKLDEASSET